MNKIEQKLNKTKQKQVKISKIHNKQQELKEVLKQRKVMNLREIKYQKIFIN